MVYYQRLGTVPHQRHTQSRDRETGALLYEELVGEEGFSSTSSLLYHRNIPGAITDATPWTPPDSTVVANHPLLARHFQLHDLITDDVDMVTGRRLILGNDDSRIYYAAGTQPSPLYRNAIGDELAYVEAGAARVETIFGPLTVTLGDYVLIPRGTTHRWIPAPESGLRLYIIEANGHINPPRRHLSPQGQFLEQSPWCERDIRGPEELPEPIENGAEVLVKHRGSGQIIGTRYHHPRHPFDLVGWDGCLYPFCLSIFDFEPITGRIHPPPTVHQTFEGPNFVVCSFVPRKVDYHPSSIPAPYYHSNVDSDEVMFYCGGSYGARAGSKIDLGSVSLHPGGFPHGPQPGAYHGSIGAESVDEYAVMVDTFRPLALGTGALACEDTTYSYSWTGKD